MNCKPGDLAIVVAANCTPEGIGRIVEICRPAVNSEVFDTIEGVTIVFQGTQPSWRVRSDTPLPWRTSYGVLYHAYETPTADVHLRPVSGISLNDKVTDDLEVTA
jgi:hypothetical protein